MLQSIRLPVLVIVLLFSIAVAFASPQQIAHAKEDRDEELLTQLAETRHNLLFPALHADQELLFQKIGGEPLLIQSARFGNHIAAIELVDRGADWLTTSSDGLPFCTLISQRVTPAQARLVGQAIVRRMRREHRLISEKKFDDFIRNRLAARQEPGFLPSTLDQCAHLLAEKERNLFDQVQVFEKLIRSPETDAEASDLFITVHRLNLIALPDPDLSGNGNRRRADNKWKQVFEYVLRRRLAEPVTMMLEGVRDPAPLRHIFSESSVPLHFLVDLIGAASGMEMLIQSGSFSNGLAARLRSRNTRKKGADDRFRDGLEILNAIQKHGLERFLVPTQFLAGAALSIFKSENSRVLLHVILTNAWNDNSASKSCDCSVGEELFHRSAGMRLDIEDYFRLHDLGFTLAKGSYTAKSRGFYSRDPRNLSFGEAAKSLRRFVRRGQISKDAMESFIGDLEKMARYEITWKDLKSSAFAFLIDATDSNRKFHLTLLEHAASRDMKCKDRNNRCSVFGEDGPSNGQQKIIEERLGKIDIETLITWAELGLNIESEYWTLNDSTIVKLIESYIINGGISHQKIRQFYESLVTTSTHTSIFRASFDWSSPLHFDSEWGKFMLRNIVFHDDYLDSWSLARTFKKETQETRKRFLSVFPRKKESKIFLRAIDRMEISKNEMRELKLIISNWPR